MATNMDGGALSSSFACVAAEGDHTPEGMVDSPPTGGHTARAHYLLEAFSHELASFPASQARPQGLKAHGPPGAAQKGGSRGF